MRFSDKSGLINFSSTRQILMNKNIVWLSIQDHFTKYSLAVLTDQGRDLY